MVKFADIDYEILTPVDGQVFLLAVERAGRVCYRSEDDIAPGSAAKFVAMLIDQGHEAMLEHAPDISVLFHVNRGLTHEFVRHRLASFAQVSTRYCNFSKKKFSGQLTLAPMTDGLTAEQLARRKWLFEHIEFVYMSETGEGVRPQQARDVLPICLQSDLVMTTNCRHWREIFRQRASKHAHPQMRFVARLLLAEFRALVPVMFDDVGDLGRRGGGGV